MDIKQNFLRSALRRKENAIDTGDRGDDRTVKGFEVFEFLYTSYIDLCAVTCNVA